MNFPINDIREKFNNISFSGYQKSKVKNELLLCLENSKIENSCYWAAELICAGHYIDLWNLIIIYISKNINLGNPKLPIYLDLRYNYFKDIINTFSQTPLELRNNFNIRSLFCEIICILVYSNKKIKTTEIKIPQEDLSEFLNISQKLKAEDQLNIENFLYSDDPKEIFIPLNEFIFSIKNKNLQDSLYWFEWIMQFENYCNKNNKFLKAKNRMFAPNGFERDIIMIIWEILFNISKEKDNLTEKIVKSLFNLFCIKYNKSFKKNRRIIIYFALQLIIENYEYEKKIITNKDKIYTIKSNINHVYKQIKKNEQSPGTEYLFKDLKGKNTQKSLTKLKILNNYQNSNIVNNNDQENDEDSQTINENYYENSYNNETNNETNND